MEVPVEMQRFKSIIVSSAVALALTAANLSAQQGPAVPGTGGGGGGAGDASAANQSAQIALETKIATGTVGIATGIHAMAEVHGRIATSIVQLAANGVSLSPAIATSLVAIATGTDGMKIMTANIATSVVKMAAAGVGTDTELPAAVLAGDGKSLPTAPFVLSANFCYNGSTLDLCRGAATGAGVTDSGTMRVAVASDNPIATAAVGIATGVHAMAEVHGRIATSVVKLAQQGLSLDTAVATSLVAIATGTHRMQEVHPHIATSAVAMVGFVDGLEGLISSGNTYLLNIATSAVSIGTGINRMQAVHPDIATSTVFSAIQNLRIATSDVAIATGINRMQEVHPHIATSVVKLAAAGLSVDPAIATSTVQSVVLETRIATSTVETASRQAVIATSAVSIADRFPDRVIGCTNQAAIATTATNYRQVIPAGTGQIIYICTELWTVTQSALISFGYGGGTNCDSGPVALTGEMSIAASSGASRGSGLGMLYQIPAGKAFCVQIATASGGAAIGGTVGYVRR